MMPEEGRTTMIVNAPTFAGESLDPSWADIDLGALSGIDVPVLFTQGDQSPPFFAKIIARMAEGMDNADVETLPGAGHLPQVTHPSQYVAAITRSLA